MAACRPTGAASRTRRSTCTARTGVSSTGSAIVDTYVLVPDGLVCDAARGALLGSVNAAQSGRVHRRAGGALTMLQRNKIVKEKGEEPTEFEDQVAQVRAQRAA